MSWLAQFYKSTIGMKVAMAVSGLILVGFVIGHMLGNLQIFLGPEAINSYAAMLKSNAALLWGTRIVVGGSILLHAYSAVVITLRNRDARPGAYVRKEDVASTFASKTIRIGGAVLLLFIVYHLLHLTLGLAHPNFSETNVFRNVVLGFRVLPVTVVYIVAQLGLGLHLYHGFYSLTRTLGLHNAKYVKLARGASIGIAAVVAGGNISIPLAVLFRIVG